MAAVFMPGGEFAVGVAVVVEETLGEPGERFSPALPQLALSDMSLRKRTL